MTTSSSSARRSWARRAARSRVRRAASSSGRAPGDRLRSGSEGRRVLEGGRVRESLEFAHDPPTDLRGTPAWRATSPARDAARRPRPGRRCVEAAGSPDGGASRRRRRVVLDGAHVAPRWRARPRGARPPRRLAALSPCTGEGGALRPSPSLDWWRRRSPGAACTSLRRRGGRGGPGDGVETVDEPPTPGARSQGSGRAGRWVLGVGSLYLVGPSAAPRSLTGGLAGAGPGGNFFLRGGASARKAQGGPRGGR